MDWVKNNWLVGLLTLLAIGVVVVMVALMLAESETLGTPAGLASLAFCVAVIAFLILVLKRPDSVARLRINLIWLSTLVAVLTLVFGNRLIELIMNPPNNKDTNTIEIVLSSLVGVGIGGLIAIAGQLVQDSDQDSKRGKSSGGDREDP